MKENHKILGNRTGEASRLLCGGKKIEHLGSRSFHKLLIMRNSKFK